MKIFRNKLNQSKLSLKYWLLYSSIIRVRSIGRYICENGSIESPQTVHY